MYKLGAAGTSTSSTAKGGTGTTTSKAGTTTSKVSTSTAPAGTGFPTGWSAQGCWVDGVSGRILNNQQPDNQALTLQSCVKTCAGLGYTIAGAEYGVQCFCDNAIYNGGVKATNQADCNVPCPGDNTEMCGAGNRMTLYSIGTPKAYAAPAAQTSGLPTGWVYSGCLQ